MFQYGGLFLDVCRVKDRYVWIYSALSGTLFTLNKCSKLLTSKMLVTFVKEALTMLPFHSCSNNIVGLPVKYF